MFSATEQNTIYKDNLQSSSLQLPWRLEPWKICALGNFLISKQLAGILLKSNLRTECSILWIITAYIKKKYSIYKFLGWNNRPMK